MEDKVLSFIVKYKTVLNKYGINTPLRQAHFFAQLVHESNLDLKKENLNYSAKRLVEVFPKYFKTLAEANNYVGKPDKIANKIYGGRMGNNTIDDGYKYIGRGYIQITGKDNYSKLSKDTGIDFVNNPDLLLQEANSLIGALWFWNQIVGNRLADLDDIESLTKKINGGLNGIDHRKSLLKEYKRIIK